MKNSKIKRVRRENLPETNSSSSHSVVISMKSENNLPKEDWDLDIDDDLVLHIPRFRDFGRSFFCSNSVLIKLQYLSGFFISGLYRNKVGISKLIHKFELALRDILGIKKIVFEDAAEVWTKIHTKEISKNDSYYYEFPTIDWQSRDLEYEILESPETIKNFLLNPESWLYGGDDSCGYPPKLFKDTKKLPEPIGITSVNLAGIGRVDIEILPNPGYDLNSSIGDSIQETLRYFVYDQSTKEFVIYEGEYFSGMNDENLLSFSTVDENFNVVFSNMKGTVKLLIPEKLSIYDISTFSI